MTRLAMHPLMTRICFSPEGGAGGPIDPTAIDWDALMRPVSEDRPGGDYLRYDGPYDAISEARRQDDPDLPQGVWEVELKRADWKRVAAIAIEVLQTKTKDFQIAAWLLESLIHLRGFAGCADGLRVLNLLTEHFWESAHPEIEDNDLDSRLAPLQWIGDKAADALRMVPVSMATPKTPVVYSMADWVAAQHLDKLAQKKPELLKAAASQGKANQAEIKLAVLELPPRPRDQWFHAIRTALNECNKLSRALDDLCGREAPSFRKLIDELQNIERLYVSLFPKLTEAAMKAPKPAEAAALPAEDAGILAEGPAAAPATAEVPAALLNGILAAADATAKQGIQSREEAYVLLEAVASYLLRTEPHSPVPYLIRRAITWGHMSFGELLGQFIDDPNQLRRLYGFLGVGEDGDGGN